MLYILIVFLVFCLGIVLFINLHPVFGGKPTLEQKESYRRLANHSGRKFVNPGSTKMTMSVGDMFSMMRDSMVRNHNRNPEGKLRVSEIDWSAMGGAEDSVTWFGHSAFLLNINQKNILVDPMLGRIASPVPFVGSKRYSEDVLHIIDEMPSIDAVLITHDHYDHLDYKSIRKLKEKVQFFFVPKGVGAHLVRWEIPVGKIIELNWWDEIEFQGLTIAFTPSKHFSGRGLFNRDSTLWGGWVVLGERTRLYTSGDGGYDAHFKEIGEKYGPFDITLIEGGQYDRRWPWVHMTPEEAIQAHIDVRGKDMMLIHWGAFTLAYHGWTEPIERAFIEAEKAGVHLLAPQLGETLHFKRDDQRPTSLWWREQARTP